MRLDRLTTLLVLIIFLAPFVPSTPAPYEFTEISEVSARDSDIEVSEVFISPNGLVSNATSTNIYGAVDWNNDGD